MAANVGDVLDVKVEKLLKFGALVSLPTGQRGLIHISQITNGYVERVEDHLAAGQVVKAKVTKIADDGKIDLSIKALQAPAPSAGPKRSGPPRSAGDGKGRPSFGGGKDGDGGAPRGPRRPHGKDRDSGKKEEEKTTSPLERSSEIQHRDPKKDKERDRGVKKYVGSTTVSDGDDSYRVNKRSIQKQLEEEFMKYIKK